VSVEQIATVLHHSRQTGTPKLLLVGIANHDGDGGAWPTIETLAKYANVTERSVQRGLEEIVAAGELRIHYNAGGNLNTPPHERPNRYEILVTCPPNCEGGRQHHLRPLEVVHGGDDVYVTPSDGTEEAGEGATPASPPHPPTPTSPPDAHVAPPPDAHVAPGGDAHVAQTVLEPSSNRPVVRRAARSSPATTRGTRLPEDWTPSAALVADAAADAPGVDQDREFRRFRDHWLGSAGRNAIKIRWDSAYRNWMRKAQDDLPASRQVIRPAPAEARLAIGMELAARLRARHESSAPAYPPPEDPSTSQGALFR
jgi:hypothetical protein